MVVVDFLSRKYFILQHYITSLVVYGLYNRLQRVAYGVRLSACAVFYRRFRQSSHSSNSCPWCSAYFSHFSCQYSKNTNTDHTRMKQRLSRIQIITHINVPLLPCCGSCHGSQAVVRILIINTYHKNISNVSEPYVGCRACQRKKKNSVCFLSDNDAKHWTGFFFRNGEIQSVMGD